MADDGKLEFANDGEILKYLDSQGTYIVRTKDEDKAYWKNTVGKEVDQKVSEIYSSFEKSIAESTGIDKNAGEKASEFLSRSITAIRDKAKATEADLTKKLEAKLKESDAAAEVQKQFETYKAQTKAQAKEFEQQIESMKTEAFRGRVQQLVNDAVGRIKPMFKKDLNDFLIENTINSITSAFTNETIPHDVNGVIVFNDKDDNPIMSTKDGKMLTAYDILLSKFPEDLIDKPRVISGGGTGQEVTKKDGTVVEVAQPGENGKYDLELPETVKTVTQLVEHLKSNLPNVPKNSPDFNEYYRANKSKVKFEA